ncbi:MAG: hypothetical protein K0S08_2138 [Gammaproteobacteria bacterium]|jgi:lysophospholipase L1-like esterase|nr:hypothetical protein [Gammaproteobacteria bacterium]
MKTILCYGDSNTWGYVPGKFDPATSYVERYPRNVRWTGRLQALLGENYYVIEEGLNGRTTNLNSPLPPDRNGKTYLLPCLYSHAPLDLVVIMLGGNDLKNFYYRSTEEIANGLKELTQLIQSTKYGSNMQSPPKILLIGYPELSSEIYGRVINDENLFEGAVAKSKEFDVYYSKLAEQSDCYYFNAAPHVKLSEIDGVHLDEEGHRVLADLLANKIREILD